MVEAGDIDLGTICIWVTAEVIILVKSPKKCVYMYEKWTVPSWVSGDIGLYYLYVEKHI